MKKKKFIAVLLAVVLSFVCLASSFSALALTQTVILDTQYVDTTDGSEDLLWYKYTPEQSGMYTFLSFNTRKSEAYLFIKTTQADGSKVYTQLAYSKSSPNYTDYGQTNSSQFCLTYHLEEGTTYYFAAGWQTATTTSATMKVKLICEGYDDTLIEKIEASCPISLTWYTDGQWLTDSTGQQYFNYNISKIISNTTVTIYYADGTTKSAAGVQEIDGLSISYNHSQNTNHWYTQSDPLYTENILTVTVLNQSVTLNINIEQSDLYAVKGTVVDYSTGDVISGAKVLLNSQSAAVTDDNGNFAFTSAPGTYMLTITNGSQSIDNTFAITVVTDIDTNNHTSIPYKLITVDYVDDEIINVKDIAAVRKSDSLTTEQQQTEISKISSLLGANSDTYKK